MTLMDVMPARWLVGSAPPPPQAAKIATAVAAAASRKCLQFVTAIFHPFFLFYEFAINKRTTVLLCTSLGIAGALSERVSTSQIKTS
jgi:hypothetical protein